jgi:Protein of unknown function (DUF3443)/Bacterial Ig-like domain (group 2)
MKLNKLAFLLPIILLVFGCGGGGGGSSRTLVSIAVTPSNPSIAIGTTQQFTAMGTFSDNITQDITSGVTWTSSGTGVATISAAGLATSVATGTTTISASSGAVSGTTALTVTTVALVSIAVTPANPTIAIGSTQQFTATGTLSDNTTLNLTPAVTWGSSTTRVATITAAGVAAPHAAGTSTITATSGNINGSTSLTVPVPAGGNALAVTVNGSLCSSAFNASYPNKPCVSVTVCTPGTSTCQTISDILLDTGSYGLRVFKQVLTIPLNQVTVGAGSLAECIQFADNSAVWGSVQRADVVLGGEPAVTVPIHVIDASFGSVPAGCVPTGGVLDSSPSNARFNGILGVGLFAEDCGAGCVSGANNRVYYACSGASCAGSAVALASQVRNPVVQLPVDNNGVLVQLPAVATGGVSSDIGQLLLGIGTQPNNTPSGVTAYPASLFGEFTTVYNGATYRSSFIDSGSNGLFFNDPALQVCSGDWYCPPTIQSLSATNQGAAGSPSGVVPFQIGNSTTLFNTGNHVFVELGGTMPPAASGFDWGLPFFFGRNVFVGIQGRSSSLGSGPYWAY